MFKPDISQGYVWDSVSKFPTTPDRRYSHVSMSSEHVNIISNLRSILPSSLNFYQCGVITFKLFISRLCIINLFFVLLYYGYFLRFTNILDDTLTQLKFSVILGLLTLTVHTSMNSLENLQLHTTDF